MTIDRLAYTLSGERPRNIVAPVPAEFETPLTTGEEKRAGGGTVLGGEGLASAWAFVGILHRCRRGLN